MIRWSWTTFDRRRTEYEANQTNGEWAHATLHRLQTTTEVDAFLDQAGRP